MAILIIIPFWNFVNSFLEYNSKKEIKGEAYENSKTSLRKCQYGGTKYRKLKKAKGV